MIVNLISDAMIIIGAGVTIGVILGLIETRIINDFFEELEEETRQGSELKEGKHECEDQ